MSTIEERLADLEARMKTQEEKAKQQGETLYGKENESGLVRSFHDLKTESKYLRLIYIAVTALLLPWINAALGKIGLGPLKIG